MGTKEKLLFLVLCQLATISFSLVLSIPMQNPDGNSINMNYLGSVEGKSFFAEMTPRRNWTEANQFCEQSGMRLASINSAAQTTLLVDAYNSATFYYAFWTAGRDAQAASQFVWNNNGDVLDNSINIFRYFEPIHTCVYWHALPSNDSSLGSNPCTMTFGALCEIKTG